MVASGLANLPNGSNQWVGKFADPTQPEPAAPKPAPVTQPEAAALLNVSERLVRDAKAIKRANPEPTGHRRCRSTYPPSAAPMRRRAAPAGVGQGRRCPSASVQWWRRSWRIWSMAAISG